MRAPAQPDTATASSRHLRVAAVAGATLIAAYVTWFAVSSTTSTSRSTGSQLGGAAAGPLQVPRVHGVADLVRSADPFTDAGETLDLPGSESATLLDVRTDVGEGNLEQIGFKVAPPGRQANSAMGALRGWPAERWWLPTPLIEGVDAPIEPLSADINGPDSTLLLIGYRLADGDDLAVRTGIWVRYALAENTYETYFPARLVVCDQDVYSAAQCERYADDLFPDG